MRRAVVVWAAAYGALRIWYATSHAPAWKLPGDDLLIPGWVAVAGCVVTALAVIRIRPRLLWVLAAGWLAAAAFILLDGVAAVLPGLGIPFDVLGMLSRLGAVSGAVLLGLLARSHQPAATPWPPWISTVGACLATAGCLTRLGAQAVVGFEKTPYGNSLSLLLFEGGFVLAGTLLPFLLVHRLGRWFPRWLLLLPGYAIGCGITAYFGVGLIQMIANAVQGQPVFGDVALGLPDSFFWVAVPAYLVWGVGLTVAARGYQLATRKANDSVCDLQITQR
ncbi:hypothetical protein JOF29_005775 [Kribbella aluminosa]|uniref:Uncharacterized protein n=1 Tax=Kribbella aluminosa TaxID=416017 RepID=A0ABS4USP3_9ACTN|nr:hypothetical protein [Kribbella aluminosa]MBP2354665.1 hypothetical protein [Kribbella aluminosa]